MAILGQNFGNNISFESEIAIQLTLTHIVPTLIRIFTTSFQHCCPPLKLSLQKSSRVESRETTMPKNHAKIYQKTVATYLP